MILKSFLLGNPLSLCIKIINSVVVVGLYYGFLTTFSIGPSYLFLLRARVMEEGTEEEVSATTGFIAGQLMMFISIYYAPLHLALGRPHTITVLVLPYILFHFFWNNNKNFFDYGSTTRNSMRNLSIQCVFLNNLICQLLNHFILPSSTLARLVNIYMFRCNNKIFFLTSSFVGWLIGHILFMKWVGLAFFWIRQNHSIRSNKYLVSELKNSMARIFSILFFITCVYYLGRMPSPIVTKKLKEKETSETEESDVETTSETKETKQEQEGSTEENPSEEKEDLDKRDETEEIRVNGKQKTKEEFHFKEARYQDSPVYEDSDLETHQLKKRMNMNKKIEILDFWIKNTFVTFFFDYKRWNRPLRYIKNDQLETALRNEMSQCFFFSCKSDDKQRISFTYPPSLSTFSEMLKQRISLYIIEKLYDKDLSISNSWIYTNEKKKFNLKNELRIRMKMIDQNEGFPSLDMLEKRTIFCDDENKKKCLPKVYDPFFNGPYRGMKNKLYSCVIRNVYTDIENLVEIFLINKIHYLLIKNSFELDRQSFFNSTEEKEIYLESPTKSLQFAFDGITTHAKDQKRRKNQYIQIKIEEVSKKVSRWSYKLTNGFEEEEEENEEELVEKDHEIYSRRARRVVIYNDSDQNTNSISSTQNDQNDDKDDEKEEVSLIRYSQQSDFRRNLIKGSMRAQRRKTVTWELFQVNVHSPLFFDRLDKTSFFSSFDINETKNFILRNWMGREQESEWKIDNLENKDTKEEKEKEKNERIEISEAWDNFIFTQAIRSLMLVTQYFLRKYILLPSFIIAKNIIRMLLLQSPEWYEDLKEWNREIYIKCTYNGVQLSEKEYPQDWLTDGIQIKILYPFCLKPWRKSKDPIKKKFCFLTVWGMEVEVPFGSPRKQPFFFEPIYKEFKKKKKKLKNKIFQVIKFIKKKKGIIKIIRVTKLLLKKMKIVNSTFLVELRKKKVNENEQDFKRNNKIIRQSSVLIRPINWLNYSLIERKIKDLSNNTIKIRNQIEQIAKDNKKKEIVLIYDKKRLESKNNILKILKIQTIRFMRKLNYFIKSFIDKIYTNIFLWTITFFKKNAQLFFESTKKIFHKSIYNKKKNQEQERINETDKNLIFTIKRLFLSTHNTKNRNENSNSFWNLSSLSQAYVFYKLSQTQLIHQLLNKYHLKSVLQYQGNSPFLKDKLQNSCMIHEIFDFESRDKKIHTYHFDLYKKYQFSHSIRKNDYVTNSLISKKDQWKKHYRYDIFSYNYIHPHDSYIYESKFKRNKIKEIPYHFNTSKPESFDVLVSIPNNDYLEKIYFIDRNTNLDRKYFDCRIIDFCFRKNLEIWTNVHIGIKRKENTMNETYNLNKMEKKKNFSPIIYQESKTCNQKINFFDCKGMNKENFYDTASNHYTIPNLKPWFFSEFVLLLNLYKIQPWIIPIKSLFFHLNRNEKSKNINKNQKTNIHISSNKKKDLELENFKKEEDEQQSQGNFALNILKQKKKKAVEEDYGRLKIKKGRKKKKYKSKEEMKLDYFLKKYLIFQLRWDDPLNQKIMKNIRIYCFLLRLINLKEITISSIQRDEINLEEMLIQNNLVLTELIRKGIFIIQQICPSIRRDGKSMIYQTIDIFLVDKKKYKTNKKYKKKEYIEKGGFKKSIIQDNKIFLSRDKNHYDFLVPENILSTIRRREFRIRICLNLKSRNILDKNPKFCNENKIRNYGLFLNADKHFHTDGKIFMKFKLFLWPNYRLEDLACMNRYWFDTNNSSRFSMSRIHMYSQLIRNSIPIKIKKFIYDIFSI
uniref:hypothetical chloroplast RF1 n=1 Tax=Chiloglottis cornuta TaxID=256349 RepID=UPI001EDDF10A|nr:hypothetical chloroplast RF1 [Chiloglottis cornuta]UIX23873.1 hypothetical chloroplast RF1 [Chiloglottis cornuta]